MSKKKKNNTNKKQYECERFNMARYTLDAWEKCFPESDFVEWAMENGNTSLLDFIDVSTLYVENEYGAKKEKSFIRACTFDEEYFEWLDDKNDSPELRTEYMRQMTDEDALRIARKNDFDKSHTLCILPIVTMVEFAESALNSHKRLSRETQKAFEDYLKSITKGLDVYVSPYLRHVNDIEEREDELVEYAQIYFEKGNVKEQKDNTIYVLDENDEIQLLGIAVVFRETHDNMNFLLSDVYAEDRTLTRCPFDIALDSDFFRQFSVKGVKPFYKTNLPGKFRKDMKIGEKKFWIGDFLFGTWDTEEVWDEIIMECQEAEQEVMAELGVGPARWRLEPSENEKKQMKEIVDKTNGPNKLPMSMDDMVSMSVFRYTKEAWDKCGDFISEKGWEMEFLPESVLDFILSELKELEEKFEDEVPGDIPITVCTLDEEYLKWLDKEENTSEMRIEYLNSLSEKDLLRLAKKHGFNESYSMTFYPFWLMRDSTIRVKEGCNEITEETRKMMEDYFKSVSPTMDVFVAPYLMEAYNIAEKELELVAIAGEYFEAGAYTMSKDMLTGEIDIETPTLAGIPVVFRETHDTMVFTKDDMFSEDKVLTRTPYNITYDMESFEELGVEGVRPIGDTDIFKRLNKELKLELSEAEFAEFVIGIWDISTTYQTMAEEILSAIEEQDSNVGPGRWRLD